MKKLVLGSLLLAAVASQTTGCIITSDEELATINAEWSFHNVSPSGTLSPSNPCPAGYDTVVLHTTEVDALNQPFGAPIVDLFDCPDMRHLSAELDPGVYQAFVSVENDAGGLYAKSLAAIVDVVDSDKTFRAEIVQNGGYFELGWDLVDQLTNAPLGCPDVPEIDAIGLTATIANGSDFVADDFDCIDGEKFTTFTSAAPAGTYVVRVQPVDRGGVPLGPGATFNNKAMGDRNAVTNLGIAVLPIP